MDLKATWKQHYSNVPRQLERLKKMEGVASVFNANIDAVLKVQPAMVLKWMADLKTDEGQVLCGGSRRISAPVDLLRGFVECFSNGIAQEWLVDSEQTFGWMRDNLGYDKLQMGGQGGIIANVMAVAGVQNVYVHCASLPDQQAGLFLDNPGLQGVDGQGRLRPASSIDREGDLPLIHWILEFDVGAQLQIGGVTLTCPKSNRFIATYDPLNFKLSVDPGFDAAMQRADVPVNTILLSGYQMLGEPLPGGAEGSGLARIKDSWAQIQGWKTAHPTVVIHFEFASTQDVKIRRALARDLAPAVDSVGCNEQELISILEVIGETDAARECAGLDSVSLFKGLLRVFERLGLQRVQLHMFGLYVTLLKPGLGRGPGFEGESNRNGMAFAATLAAAKAGTGSLEHADGLLWAHGRDVSDQSLKELVALDAHIAQTYGKTGLAESGIIALEDFTLVAVPTILIEKPVTLVGMGDTISSLSLVGALTDFA